MRFETLFLMGMLATAGCSEDGGDEGTGGADSGGSDNTGGSDTGGSDNTGGSDTGGAAGGGAGGGGGEPCVPECSLDEEDHCGCEATCDDVALAVSCGGLEIDGMVHCICEHDGTELGGCSFIAPPEMCIDAFTCCQDGFYQFVER